MYLILVTPKRIEEQLDLIFAEAKKEAEHEKRMAATARLTIGLKSGKQLTGVTANFSGLTVLSATSFRFLNSNLLSSQGQDRNQLVLWLGGTQSDVVFLDIATIEALVRSQTLSNPMNSAHLIFCSWIVHNVANHVHWLVKDWVAPPVQATLPGMFQVTKKAQ